MLYYTTVGIGTYVLIYVYIIIIRELKSQSFYINDICIRITLFYLYYIIKYCRTIIIIILRRYELKIIHFCFD